MLRRKSPPEPGLNPPSNLHNRDLGRYGEDLAVHYLISHGYRIITRNFRKGYGEIDIVAQRRNTLVFVEVKARIGHECGLPEEAVTPRKIRELTQVIEYFLMMHPGLPEQLRLDVIAVDINEDGSPNEIRHHESITG